VTALRPPDAAGTLTVRDGVVVYASEGVAAIAGRAVGDLVGRPFVEFIVEEEREVVAERHARRRKGEPVPQRYELTIALPDGGRRLVEVHVDMDGGDFLVHLRDVALREAHRIRLEAVATLGAALQRELTEEGIFARVREDLRALGLSCALMRAEPDGVRVVWASVPPMLAERFLGLVGVPLDGYLGRWSELSRRVFQEGWAFSEDWGFAASRFVPEPHAAVARAAVNATGLSRAAAVRLGDAASADLYLVVAGSWLGTDDAPALRLFAAQLTAALGSARTIADLSRRNADLAALNRVAELAGEATDLAGFLARASEVLRGAAGCTGMAVFVLDAPAGEFVRLYADGASPEVAAGFERFSLSSPLGQIMGGPTPGVLETANVPELRIRRLGFRSVARVPLIARSKTVGILATGFAAPAAEVRGRLDLLTAVAAHVAAAVESHGLLADLRRRVGELTLLNDVALASTQHDPSALLASAIRSVCETVGVDVGSAYVREGERLVLVADHGMSRECARSIATLALGEGAPGLAVERAAPVLGDSTEAYAGRCAHMGTCAEVNVVVAVPLLAKTQAVGALALGRRERRGFSPGEVRLLSAIGVQLGVALDAARLFADVTRRASDLEAVNALALRMFEVAPGDLGALLEAGCREIATALSCRAAAVFLAEGSGVSLRGAAAWGEPLDVSGLVIDLDADWLARQAMHRKVPASSEDVTHDPRSAFCERPGMPPLAMLAVPLGSRGETPGVVFLADPAGRTFKDAEVALATALAGGLGMGLENARLYADARRRVEELSLLNEMGRTIAASLDLDHVLREGADAARRLVDASRAVVLLYDPLRSELRFSGGVGFSGNELERIVIPVTGGTIAPQVVRERRPIVVDDAAAHPGIHQEYQRYFAPRSLIAAPVLLRGEPLGVLVVDEHRKDRRFTATDVERVTAVANQLAVAIENARLYAEARDRLREVTTVIDVARVVSSSLDLEEVLGAGAEHLMRTLEASACTILLLDARGGDLRRAAARGQPIGPDRVPSDVPSLPREALEARAPVVGRGGPVAAILAVPLHVRDVPVGVALVAGATADRVFTPGELARANAIASQLAVAVDNARLYSETRRRAEELGLLHEVGRSLVETLDIQQLLERGVHNLARIVDAPHASLLLVAPDGRSVEVRAIAGTHSLHLGMRLPLDPPESSLAALVFQRREPVVIEDALVDSRVNPRLRAQTGSRGYLGLPLVVRERTIGAVIIMEPRGPRRFTPAEVERAAAIANQLAVAVENARLYEDLRKSYAELERAQHRLIQRERLAALGELSAVVAHEVRNPLGVIFNSLGSLRRLVRPTGDAKLLLDIVGEEADRLNRIVGDLLDFARPSTPELRPEPLDRVVDEAVGAALAQRPPGVEVARETDPAVPLVPMDARLVRQAVLNVAVNAVQAMPRGGRITVRTRRAGESVVLEIEDTGAGIPDEVRARIFEPFFTTKASGTGLGLAVVKRIVEGHGGAVAVANRPGAGAVFALSFPLAAAAVEKEPAIG
jgi:PAS domain S-box-containing protein